MKSNQIVLRRNFLNWEWYDESKMVHMFIHLLLLANDRKGEWRDIPIKRGQAITSRRRLLIETGMAEATIRSCFAKLEKSNAITLSPVSLYTTVTVCNYDVYSENQPLKDSHFIVLRRRFLQWEWYDNSKMVHLFIHLLLSASDRDDKWRGMPVKRGEVITSQRRLVVDTGISEVTIRSCLTKLKKMKEITMSPIGIYTVITICNYEKYAMPVKRKVR